MQGQDPAVAARARFWWRTLAFFIDCCAVVFAVGLIGLVFFAPTGGTIRTSSVLFVATYCSPSDLNLAEFAIPEDFRITNAARCTTQFFGYVHDRFLVIREVKRSESAAGMSTVTRSIRYPVDADGRPAHAFYVDQLTLFVLFIYSMLMEWRYGQTLGKRILRILVRSLNGDPLTFTQSAKRTGIRFIPFYPLILMYVAIAAGQILVYFGLAIAGSLLFIAMALNFIITVLRGNLPWHDRFAGTEAIRLTVQPRTSN